MHTVLIVIHVLLAIALIGMVLVQRGPGASAGAAFGSGASSTVFGSQGAGSFLTRTTGVLATGFFLVSLVMAILVSRGSLGPAAEDLGVMSGVTQESETAEDVPAAPEVRDADSDSDVPATPVQSGAAEEESADEEGDGA